MYLRSQSWMSYVFAAEILLSWPCLRPQKQKIMTEFSNVTGLSKSNIYIIVIKLLYTSLFILH